jgi:hypothetical protein
MACLQKDMPRLFGINHQTTYKSRKTNYLVLDNGPIFRAAEQRIYKDVPRLRFRTNKTRNDMIIKMEKGVQNVARLELHRHV